MGRGDSIVPVKDLHGLSVEVPWGIAGKSNSTNLDACVTDHAIVDGLVVFALWLHEIRVIFGSH